MYLKKLLLSIIFALFSTLAFSQLLSVNTTNATDTACQGDTAFRQIIFTNNGNVQLVIDSIVAPPGFGRKGSYPITVTVASTSPNNIATVDFFHEGSTIGLYSDTFKVYSNAANVPRPFKIAANMRIAPKPTAAYTINNASQCFTGNSFTFTNGSTISSGTITYEWQFGDVTSATTTNANKSYTTADSFNVLLIVTSNYGCEDLLFKWVYVNPMPASQIYVSDTAKCLRGNVFNFNDTSTLASGTLSRLWRFGNGDTSTQKSPVKSYTADSVFYTVKLVSTSDKGCKDSTTKKIYVYPNPVSAYTVNDTDQCINGNSFVFTNNSTIKTGFGPLSYKWAFAPGDSSFVTNPTKTFSTTGSRTVRLISITNKGCSDTLANLMYVYSKPTVGYIVNDTDQCRYQNKFDFNNTSTIATTDVLSYLWKFGDATTDTAKNPSHSYATYNTYSVKLIVTSDKGCKDSLSKSMIVFPQPVASFTINDSDQCLNSHSFLFTNGSNIPSGSITGYSWRFGNGDTANTTNAIKTNYSTGDTLTVSLIATSNKQCYDTANKLIILFPTPVLGYSVSPIAQCFKGNVTTYDDTSKIKYGTLSYLWAFGDGATATKDDTTYTYFSAGTYNVKHTVTSNKGCVVKDSVNVTIYDSPVADFAVTDSAMCRRGNKFDFFDNTVIGSGTYTPFWKFGNGDTVTSSSPSYAYATSDTFDVRLIVTSNHNCKDSITKKVITFPHPHTLFNINLNPQCFVGHSFSFTDTSTIKYGTMTYKWDFGDGNSSTTQSPTGITYAAPNTYNVKLTATSDQGCDSSLTKQVFLYDNPVASFTVNDSTQCVNNNQFNYTNTSTAPAGLLFYDWTLGNGNTASTKNASVIYFLPDTMVVKMVIRTDKNCKDSVTHTMIVYPKPTVTFTTDKTTSCLDGNIFKFKNTSIIDYGTITSDWDLGDGNTSNLDSFYHSYGIADTFKVQLRGISDQGCADSVTRNLYVRPSPQADFTVNDSVQCINGNKFDFTDNSFISAGGLIYQWDFGDFSTSSDQNPSYTYDHSDTFDVRLIVTLDIDNKCKDTAIHKVIVLPVPTAEFDTLLDQYCQDNGPVTLYPKYPGGVFTGDNVSGNTFNPTPTQTGWNYITYTVVFKNLCRDSLTDSTLVVVPPNFDLGQDTLMCKEDFITLNAETLGATYLWDDSTTNPYNRYFDEGTHWVVVTNACTKPYFVDSIKVMFTDFPCDAFIPNAFTPEGNTVNDYFVPYIDTTIVTHIEFSVYSRWGTKVFESTDLKTRGWDGKFNGNPCPEGVYAYLIKLTVQREDVRNLKILKGNVTLLR